MILTQTDFVKILDVKSTTLIMIALKVYVINFGYSLIKQNLLASVNLFYFLCQNVTGPGGQFP